MTTSMTTLSGIDWNRCPAWIGISVRLRSESLSGIIGIRIPTRATPELQATLRAQRGVALPTNCRVTWVSYAGEEGGIVCKLEGTSDLAEAVFASITHLRFDARLPLARDIAAYQKHRVKRLRRQRP